MNIGIDIDGVLTNDDDYILIIQDIIEILNMKILREFIAGMIFI